MRVFFPAIQKTIQSTMPSIAHISDLIGREKLSLASQCIKTKKNSVYSDC